MKTYQIKPNEVQHRWFLVDLAGQTLGRAISKIAFYLQGKHKPVYAPHLDAGDYIVVVNAKQVVVTGNKRKDKEYFRHTGYPGGIKSRTFEKAMEHDPEQVIQHAVKGMMKKGPLGDKMMSKLFVYPDASHPHTAQQPEVLPLELK